MPPRARQRFLYHNQWFSFRRNPETAHPDPRKTFENRRFRPGFAGRRDGRSHDLDSRNLIRIHKGQTANY